MTLPVDRNRMLQRLRRAAAIALLAGLAFWPALTAATPQDQPAQGQAKPAAAPAKPQAQAKPVAPPTAEQALSKLKLREIGPANMGGRVDDFAVVESDPNIVYVGFASSGVWKTTNGGTTWEPIFDKEAVSTVGALALAPSDPSILWVGTGEANNRQSSSWGNGVYKSTDAGRTFKNMGLADSQAIGAIAVHPVLPDIVYVAAAGHLWGPNKERGVYKTSDGGRSWKQVLFVNEDTGAFDLAMDPRSPDTLYAATYQRRRAPFGFNGSGPGSAIYKTTDGGANWVKLTKGLPYENEESPETGRIGLTIYRRDPNIVYATVEHAQGGIFRSDDKGETWRKMSPTQHRPMYYSRIFIDPNNDLRIWMLGAPMLYSEDGGKSFRTDRVRRIHGDYHAMWIDPKDSRQMIVGSDGGLYWSHDAGRSWDYVDTIAVGQFYEVGYDMAKPYRVYGGLQDNGNWGGPSRTRDGGGISNEEWESIGGGDGFYVQVDPSDPNTVYAESQDGYVYRLDLRTTEQHSIRPRQAEGEHLRFQWNSPILISRHDPKRLYYGAQFLYRSENRGDTWTKISPDLTTGQDRVKLSIMGKVPDAKTRSRHDGVQDWPCITTLGESPVDPAVLWVGTDDGCLQVTRDGGKTWENVIGRVPNLPRAVYVSRVEPSRTAAGAAYAAFDGHRQDDFGVYVFATTDFGRTWKDVSAGLPRNKGTVSVIREHFRNPNLLFVGTEYGAYVSLDRGSSWMQFKLNLPTVPVDDIAIHPRENDLILGTHGRSIWILDDLAPLEQMSDSVLKSDVFLFDPRPAVAYRMHLSRYSTGHKYFSGPNPPYGAVISYYLKAKPGKDQKVTLTVADASGKKIREVEIKNAEAGVNRASWDLRYDPAFKVAREQESEWDEYYFGGFGPMAQPGTYTLTLTVDKTSVSKPVVVEDDPTVQVSAADRAARWTELMRLFDLDGRTTKSYLALTKLKKSLAAVLADWAKPDAAKAVPDEVKKAAESLQKSTDEVLGKYMPPESAPGDAGPPAEIKPPTLMERMSMLTMELEEYTAAPSEPLKAEITVAIKEAGEVIAAGDKILNTDLVELNKKINQAGIPLIRATVEEKKEDKK